MMQTLKEETLSTIKLSLWLFIILIIATLFLVLSQKSNIHLLGLLIAPINLLLLPKYPDNQANEKPTLKVKLLLLITLIVLFSIAVYWNSISCYVQINHSIANQVLAVFLYVISIHVYYRHYKKLKT
tara:strand:- start:212 stop:592 length:381 start_codon:yes stop_codon:yes gene_type:complete